MGVCFKIPNPVDHQTLGLADFIGTCSFLFTMITGQNEISWWSNLEVETFLGIIADEQLQRELQQSIRNEHIYREVSKRMASHGYKRTYKQCREKLKKMKSDHRTIRGENSLGASRRRNWRWFSQMDAIYGHRPVKREGGADSTTALAERESSYIHEAILAPLAASTPTRPSASAPPPPSTSATSFTTESCYVHNAISSPLVAWTLAPPAASTPAPSAALTPAPPTASTLAPPPVSTPAAPSAASASPLPSTSARFSRTQQNFITGKRKRSNSLDIAAALDDILREGEILRVQRDEHIDRLLSEAREDRKQEAAFRREEISQNAALIGVLGELVQAITSQSV